MVLVLALLLALSSCGDSVSSYRAVGLVRMSTRHSCETSFYRLDGRLVFNLKKTDSNNEGNISYSLQVEEGELYLYYDYVDGVKEELSHVKGGESDIDAGGYIEGGKSVRIIIEANGAKNGKVSVELNAETN